MNTKNQDQETALPEAATHEEQGHVHGPNCNHGHARLEPLVRLSPKVGRNDDCICGSQKKFKKCCGK